MEDEQPQRLIIAILICLLVSLPIITLIDIFFSKPTTSESIINKPEILEDQNSVHSPSLFVKARRWLYNEQGLDSLKEIALGQGPKSPLGVLNHLRSETSFQNEARWWNVSLVSPHSAIQRTYLI